MVYSRAVAAFSSPPKVSKISAISCAVYEREPLNSRCSMKCDTPAFVSVSSREPAPIQNPMATERTPGSRSEITRSPESSSERTYFCTGPLSQGRHELPVRREQRVHELVDLGEGEVGRGVGIEHRSVVDVLAVPGQRRLDRELLHIHVRAHERRQLRRQRADRLGGDAAGAGAAGHLDAAVRQVLDQAVVHDVAVERERLASLESVND